MDNDTLIRSRQRVIVTVVALLLGPVFMIGPAAGGVWLFVANGFSLTSAFVLLVFVGGSAFISYHMLQNFHWVEFDGVRIRGRRFWTRQLVDQAVQDIVEIRPLGSLVRNTTTAIIDKLIGPVLFYEIRFREGPSIGLVCYDMTNVNELVRAVEQAVERAHCA